MTTDHNTKAAPVLAGSTGKAASTGLDLLDAMNDAATRVSAAVHSIIESYGVRKYSTTPMTDEQWAAWAVGRLREVTGDPDADPYRAKAGAMREWLRLASGEGSAYRFELWTQPARGRFKRLHGQYEFLSEAEAQLAVVKARFPDAHIMQVVGSVVHGCDDPALLDTLLGELEHLSTAFPGGGEEERFEVRDATGRTVVVAASVLSAHPVFERASPELRETVVDSMERTAAVKARAQAGGL